MQPSLDALLTRRSVGKVHADEVPRALLEELVLAAVHAPNHHLTEPWRFTVISGDARRRIGDAHVAALTRVRGPLAEDVATREAARLERAPVVIACAVCGDRSDPVTAREDRDAVAAAIQNLLLAAHIRGLGAMWRTGGMVDEPEVHAALELPPDAEIVGFVYLGRPAVTPEVRPRDVTGVVRWRDR